MRIFSPAVMLPLVGSLAFAQPVGAQPTHDTVLVARRLSTANLTYLGATLAQERGVGRRTTLLYGAGVHYSFYGTSQPVLGTRFINVVDRNFGRDYSTGQLTPYVFLEGRLYTNLLKRAARSQDVRRNAGSYVAAFGEVPFATGKLINVENLALGYPVGLKLGLRRNVSQHLYADGSVALVSLLSARQSSLGPRLDAALGWAF